VSEQRYKAVLAVIADGRTVDEVVRDWGVSRRTAWASTTAVARPAHCPHQTAPAVEAMVLEMRRAHSYWEARRIAFELARKRVELAPSESAVYRFLVRAGVIDPMTRRRRRETWKRWERAAPMELWQLDVVPSFLLADGSSAKALTEFAVQRLVERAGTRPKQSSAKPYLGRCRNDAFLQFGLDALEAVAILDGHLPAA
jgi:transposase